MARVTMCLGLAGMLTAATARAQVVHGVVLYTHSDGPVAMAMVTLVDTTGVVVAGTLSALDGRFSLPVPEDGSYLVHVEHVSAWASMDGPLALSTSTPTMVTFHLQPQPIALEALTVEVEGRSLALARTGFYQREERTPGFFLDLEDIDRRRPIRTSDLIRNVPGVRFIEGRTAGFGGYPLMSYALRSQLDQSRPPCFPRVYIDGVMVEQGGSGWVPTMGFDDLIQAYDVGGMEVYRSPAETPMEFGGMTACGVIVLWTKSARRGR